MVLDIERSYQITENKDYIKFKSFTRFWKNCSLAYANQCIEQGFILQAIPHLLATQQINKAIEKLCDTNFHREAWCIAKVSKESEDKIFEIIVSKWIGYLEQLGNLEGASLMYVKIIFNTST